jgi:hypothetical protein
MPAIYKPNHRLADWFSMNYANCEGTMLSAEVNYRNGTAREGITKAGSLIYEVFNGAEVFTQPTRMAKIGSLT